MCFSFLFLFVMNDIRWPTVNQFFYSNDVWKLIVLFTLTVLTVYLYR